jgi:hypothetical protein
MECRQAPTSSLVERRAFERVRLDCPARLVTVGGQRVVQLCDLSRSGARLSVDNPPAEGITALLQWGPHESLCTVVWASESACGVAFEKMISPELVASGDELPPSDGDRLAAGVTRIQFGTKRRALASSVDHPPEKESAEIACWSLMLPRYPRETPITAAHMTAAEEMFFLGSPLAHVAVFETHEPRKLRHTDTTNSLDKCAF